MFGEIEGLLVDLLVFMALVESFDFIYTHFILFTPRTKSVCVCIKNEKLSDNFTNSFPHKELIHLILQSEHSRNK